MIELNTRLRPYNELYQYPTCMYENQDDISTEAQPSLLERNDTDELLDPRHGSDDVNSEDDETCEEECYVEDSQLDMSPEAL